jgi:hypothetical protein
MLVKYILAWLLRAICFWCRLYEPITRRVKNTMIWLSRASGIGYRQYGPLEETDKGIKRAIELRHKADRLARDLEIVERELQRRGRIRVFPSGYNND